MGDIVLIRNWRTGEERPKNSDTAVDAVAEAWASLDGKYDHYEREREQAKRDGRLNRDLHGYTGHYEGYQVEAEELIARIEKRGFVIKRKDDAS